MPEGDTIFRAARTLHRALAGKPVVNTVEKHLKTNPVKTGKAGMIEAVTQWLKTHGFLKAA